ncbi:MAG: dihydrodipicolinate synthase family protein [SAR324 cluster bacterium]|nr:dihydrodipicolinate synthase family protein [SAR324 cluster bacterium]|tara:strand:+ start:776 stop:1711 length:936 start_codon:yes stop_codon:yes gene_type:complete
MENEHVFRGCIPAIMTPCNSKGEPDFDALVRKAKQLIEAGMQSVVYCGSMGDWPLLTDEQRQKGVSSLTNADIPVIVGTGAQNTLKASLHSKHALENGAIGLMIIPRVLSRGSSPSAQKNHFESILEAGKGLPSVIYNSPYYGFETKADLFFNLRKNYPQLVGFKEFGGAGALSYAAENITETEEELALVVGVDTQVFHGIVNCGAIGVITGIGNVLPEAVIRLYKLCIEAANGSAKSRRLALELNDALKVLSTFDEGPDLVLFYKYLLTLKGEDEYNFNFYESDKLSESQSIFAKKQFKLFNEWWQAWDK